MAAVGGTEREVEPDRLLAWVMAVAGATPRRLADVVATTPDDVLRRRPAPAAWSALEVIHHLVDYERDVWMPRVRGYLDGVAVIPTFHEHGHSWDLEASPSELVRALGERRQATLRLLAALGPADLGRSAVHERLGPLTLGQHLHYLAAHDLAHLQQIDRATMQPLLGGAAPWLSQMADMVIDPE